MAASAQAGSLQCKDVGGQRLAYALSQSDGGAQIGSSESLKLDGDVLIKKSPHSPDTDVMTASFSVAEEASKVLLRTKADNKKFELVAFVAKATVRPLSDEEVQPLYEGLVTCERRTYKGPPIP